MPHFILTFIGITIIPDLLIYWFFLRQIHSPWMILHWLPLLAMVVLAVPFALTLNQNILRVAFIIFVCLTIPKIIFLLSCWAGRAISLSLAALTLVVLVIAVSWGWRHVVVKRVVLPLSGLPVAFNDYKIVHISDLHLGTYTWSSKTVQEIVARTNALKPDLIVFTGDIINISPDELEPFTQILCQLHARDGVYSILGNHDYCTYLHLPDSARTEEVRRLQDMERAMGWTLLLNENRLITHAGDTLAVVGVENDSNPPFPQRGDLPRATAGIPDNAYSILLSHDPTHWRRKVLSTTDIPVMFAGHTHGTQFRIGTFSPAAFIYKEWGGVYREQGRILSVSTGAGSNVPCRLGAWPEIVETILVQE